MKGRKARAQSKAWRLLDELELTVGAPEVEHARALVEPVHHTRCQLSIPGKQTLRDLSAHLKQVSSSGYTPHLAACSGCIRGMHTQLECGSALPGGLRSEPAPNPARQHRPRAQHLTPDGS
eukprot:1685881-Rhodomonas_salina.1